MIPFLCICNIFLLLGLVQFKLSMIDGIASAMNVVSMLLFNYRVLTYCIVHNGRPSCLKLIMVLNATTPYASKP